MYKIKNKKVQLIALDDKGRELEKKTIQNRILDNGLDYFIYSMLPLTLANTVFPQFSETGFMREISKGMPMQTSFLKFNTPQTITDSSTTMSYDTMGYPYIFDAGVVTAATETVGAGGKTVSYNYKIDTSSITTGSSFEGIGFGKVDIANATFGTDLGYVNYLLSYIDLGVLGLNYDLGIEKYQYVREDEITTNEKVMNGDDISFIPGVEGGILTTISVCGAENGTNVVKDYDLGDLTFAYIGPGEVKVAGFDNYTYENSKAVYPGLNLYPDTNIYPSIKGEIMKSIKMTYTIGLSTIETYLNIRDLDISYNNQAFYINLKCQRGE